MSILRKLGQLTGLAMISVLLLVGCGSKRPAGAAGGPAGLAPCPQSPNCVSSDADAGDSHRVEPFVVAGEPESAWQAAVAAVGEFPRATVVETTDTYLHVEVRSKWLGFVDDLELELRPGEQVIAVRSASRVGYSDLGVNRERVEALRTSLAKTGLFR